MEKSGEIHLDGEHSKNGERRSFPFSELKPLADLLYRQRAHTDAVENKTGKSIKWVFHRNGKAIRDYYGAWRAACVKAGLGHVVKDADGSTRNVAERMIHDFRRTAVNRLEWSGVPRAVAMKLTGHETDAVYSRYSIARAKDLRAGVARVADYIMALNGSGKESGKESRKPVSSKKEDAR
jgi:integrase